MEIELTDDEIIEAFGDALGIEPLELDPNAKTKKELREIFHYGREKMDEYIQGGLEAGRLERVRKLITRSDGKTQPVDAYRPVDKNE